MQNNIFSFRFKTIDIVARLFLANKKLSKKKLYTSTKFTYSTCHKIFESLKKNGMIKLAEGGREIFYSPTEKGIEFFNNIYKASSMLREEY